VDDEDTRREGADSYEQQDGDADRGGQDAEACPSAGHRPTIAIRAGLRQYLTRINP
jgi:hypothetical protein